MNWGVPSFTRYFVILLLVFFFALYEIHDFKKNYQDNFLFETKESEF